MRVFRRHSRACDAIGCACSRIVHGIALLQDNPGRGNLPVHKATNATTYAASQQHGCIVPRLPDLLYLLPNRQRQLPLTSSSMECKLPVEHWKEILGSIKLLG